MSTRRTKLAGSVPRGSPEFVPLIQGELSETLQALAGISAVAEPPLRLLCLGSQPSYNTPPLRDPQGSVEKSMISNQMGRAVLYPEQTRFQ